MIPPLGFLHLKQTFIICGTGIGLAVIFFIMELFISRVQRFPKKVTRSKKVKRVKNRDQPKGFRPEPKELNFRRAISSKIRNWPKEIISAERAGFGRKRAISV